MCEYDYGKRTEQQGSFLPGWSIDEKMNFTDSILNAFRYRSGSELGTYINIGDHGNYASGGYVYEFRGSLTSLRTNLSKLHHWKWIDAQTRAIIIQLSLYNPNIHMFISVTLLSEFLSTGQIVPNARIEPIDLESKTP